MGGVLEIFGSLERIEMEVAPSVGGVSSIHANWRLHDWIWCWRGPGELDQRFVGVLLQLPGPARHRAAAVMNSAPRSPS